jgi:tetratricopeptide (TPR) repeat protein
MAKRPVLFEKRNLGNKAAIIFIHGFGGNLGKTWGDFPDILGNVRRIKGWDIFSLGYASRLFFDLPGLWSADPPIQTLADYLRTAVAQPPLVHYESLALLAHSMGGLVVQRALLDDDQLTERVRYVFLFGTPSKGLVKASFFTWLKRQISNMADDSKFIKSLRKDWEKKFGSIPPFTFLAIAGDQDEFVPRVSSHSPFPEARCRVVSGNHLEIVKPASEKDMSAQLVLNTLVGARKAVELTKFVRIVERLEPRKDKIDDRALVELALAMEKIGRQEDAIKLLEEQDRQDTDVMGTLAGRLKRRWLHERRKADAEKALKLYVDAFQLAKAANKFQQAFYHGINVAFMTLAYRDDHRTARTIAKEVLAYCEQAPASIWRYATEGESHLMLGETDAALESYQKAVDMDPAQWQRDSMYQQAMLVVGLLGKKTTAALLDSIFEGGDS